MIYSFRIAAMALLCKTPPKLTIKLIFGSVKEIVNWPHIHFYPYIHGYEGGSD